MSLTRQPEYFDFWLGKPLQERDFGIKTHKRKAWKRPHSDYGNRLGGRRNGSGEDGEGGKGKKGGLETLIELDDRDGLGEGDLFSKGKGGGEGGGEGDGDGTGKTGGDGGEGGEGGKGGGGEGGAGGGGYSKGDGEDGGKKDKTKKK